MVLRRFSSREMSVSISWTREEIGGYIVLVFIRRIEAFVVICIGFEVG